MSDEERARLGRVATREIEKLSPIWTLRTSTVKDGVTTEGYKLSDVHELGWMESQHARDVAIRTVHDEIIAPLTKVGIVTSIIVGCSDGGGS